MRIVYGTDGSSTYPEEPPVEDGVEVEERAASMVKVEVWESTLLMFPTAEAWKVYPSLRGL